MKTPAAILLAILLGLVAAADAAECRKPVTVMDIFFTLLAAGGVQPAPDVKLDGLDQKPLLADPAAKLERDAVFFHYPHYYETTTPVSAIRARDWKLLEYLEDNRVELFNLKDDPGEKTDLAKQQPGKAAELLARLHTWREEVGAAMPTVNPNFKGKR